MSKLNNEERHTQPLKTALNSRVPKNPTSAGQATRAGQAGGSEEKEEEKKGESSTIVVISPAEYRLLASGRKPLGNTHRAAVSAPDTSYSSQTNFSHRLQSNTYN